MCVGSFAFLGWGLLRRVREETAFWKVPFLVVRSKPGPAELIERRETTLMNMTYTTFLFAYVRPFATGDGCCEGWRITYGYRKMRSVGLISAEAG